MAFVLSAIFIPIICLIAIVIGDTGWSLSSKTDLQKCSGYLALNIFLCAVINIVLYFGATSHVRFNEVLNYQILRIQHLERWTTRESRTETYQSGTDSEGNAIYSTRTVYYTRTHGPYWYSFDNLGNRRNISSREYDKWSSLWGNESKIGINRGSSASLNRSISGNIYGANWNGEFDTIYPYQRVGRYVNKIRAYDSSLSRGIADEETISKFPRPADTPSFMNSIVNHSQLNISNDDQMIFRRLNAKMGVNYQIHNIILLFDSNEYDQYVVQDVLNAWDGTNKNELATFIGLNGSKISWVESHSWSDNSIIHSNVERDIRRMDSIDFHDLKNILQKNISKHWLRKSFGDFDYIRVRIHWGWILGAYVVTIFVSLKSYYWINYIEKKHLCIRTLNKIKGRRI